MVRDPVKRRRSGSSNVISRRAVAFTPASQILGIAGDERARETARASCRARETRYDGNWLVNKHRRGVVRRDGFRGGVDDENERVYIIIVHILQHTIISYTHACNTPVQGTTPRVIRRRRAAHLGRDIVRPERSNRDFSLFTRAFHLFFFFFYCYAFARRRTGRVPFANTAGGSVDRADGRSVRKMRGRAAGTRKRSVKSKVEFFVKSYPESIQNEEWILQSVN